jgi:hypothetical protein
VDSSRFRWVTLGWKDLGRRVESDWCYSALFDFLLIPLSIQVWLFLLFVKFLVWNKSTFVEVSSSRFWRAGEQVDIISRKTVNARFTSPSEWMTRRWHFFFSSGRLWDYLCHTRKRRKWTWSDPCGVKRSRTFFRWTRQTSPSHQRASVSEGIFRVISCHVSIVGLAMPKLLLSSFVNCGSRRGTRILAQILCLDLCTDLVVFMCAYEASLYWSWSQIQLSHCTTVRSDSSFTTISSKIFFVTRFVKRWMRLSSWYHFLASAATIEMVECKS